MAELNLPPSVERRNKLDISLGYCNEIDPQQLVSLGRGSEIRVDNPEQLIDFLENDAEEDRLYFVQHLNSRGNEWEYVCFAKRRHWSLFCSIYSTSLAYNPMFADGKRRRLCCGGTRILARPALEGAVHREFGSTSEALVAALEMDLDLSEAMTGKNLSNGFNIGGSKTLVFAGGHEKRPLIAPQDVREFARFMAKVHNSIIQSIPVFIGTGSDLNFHEHGEHYYDYCSRISPCYVGNTTSATRWGRATGDNTTKPTADGVTACLAAIIERLQLEGDQRRILVKGLGGIGKRVAQTYIDQGWKVYATEMRPNLARQVREELGDGLELVSEDGWSKLEGISIFSPNASSGSVTRSNLPALKSMGVKAVIGGENNILEHGLDADEVFASTGIWTFADFLLNGGGAWIVGAEMIERPVENVGEWIRTYQVPTMLRTVDLAESAGKSPQNLFLEFIGRKVSELVA